MVESNTCMKVAKDKAIVIQANFEPVNGAFVTSVSPFTYCRHYSE
ncbi:hypothetical protein HMPREF1565_0085 [Providencia alcalifaciens RIMD 1656011]|uniref:Uncharacterized protein n=1 Tax=Providencia alcalifaciens 205/92 TaxID=1256988 RepID=A0AAV3MA00_9GAMM|nr:hypothetical protein HMPREF1562_0671 [Providencia alcalifaciens F90-2004]EUC96982.1 hypothetical protein HMPREF1567_1932 [Providencia alcalifaciens PAL-2]EUD04425.1 hypothetical protein HMPREF1565_0085 [Providencia alcalifaciens RIMD 1656011]EUD06254.1 hypothetical protein HMPREF1564_1444 [Providencia alcalifaciens R90-1475]EUD12350.1 hypothetical protein HMPREF1563_3023 [Providencia alcalifaciens 205/92]